MDYFYCNACHYCFTDSQMPDRCPDCGKQTFQRGLAVRLATEEEIADYIRILQIPAHLTTHSAKS